MKYIRTKNGHIYEIETLEYSGVPIGHFKGANDNFNIHNSLRKWQLECKVPYCLTTPDGYTTCEKQADTIEELCDKYYGVEENGDVEKIFNWSKDAYPIKPHEWAIEGFCTKEDITIDELKNRFPKGIFGAIVWFDSKGNLHIDIVAKMNDKGELELL